MLDTLPNELEQLLFQEYLGESSISFQDYERAYWKDIYNKNLIFLDTELFKKFIKKHFYCTYSATYKFPLQNHGRVSFAKYGFEVDKKGNLVYGSGRHYGDVSFDFYLGYEGTVVINTRSFKRFIKICNNKQKKLFWIASKILPMSTSSDF